MVILVTIIDVELVWVSLTKELQGLQFNPFE